MTLVPSFSLLFNHLGAVEVGATAVTGESNMIDVHYKAPAVTSVVCCTLEVTVVLLFLSSFMRERS